MGERAVVPCGGSRSSTQVGFVLFSIFGAIFVGVIFDFGSFLILGHF